ncbi:MAG: hypothetical protein M3R15_32220 [Acidobacteriota bacterium]|nr:hypothetical protein [Acidobacteriota bacterium]
MLCFCLCFGFIEARAQYRFDHWTADNGLPQNSARDIVQTQDEYLWLATFDGLVRCGRDRGQLQRKFSINIMSLLA